MEFMVRPEVKIFYPTACFGCLMVEDLQNMKRNNVLEEGKRGLEKKIRETYPDSDLDPVIIQYSYYYDRWGKAYPITYQINSVKKGRGFPNVSTLVDPMFMAELEDRILTSGHDGDTFVGVPVFDLADEGDEYVKLNGEKQVLVKNDIVLRDDLGVLASILYGPATRTSITMKTRNPVYFAWCPINISTGQVDEHLSTIERYLRKAYGEIKSIRKIA